MVLMKKKWKNNRTKRLFNETWRMWVNVRCMIDWTLSQHCRDKLDLYTVDQLVRAAKNETLFYLSQPGIRHRLTGPVSDCKWWVFFRGILSKILRSSDSNCTRTTSIRILN